MEPRPAATVILARPSDEGVEVLVLTRSMDSRFLPGFTVFPGGTIEPEDYDLAARLFGASGQAARACALRELYEEAAILLTRTGQIARAPEAPLDSLAFDPPAPRRLVEVARWVAPEFLETRFDATFFAASAARGVEPVPDLAEVSDARWATPQGVLDARSRGEARIMWPTLVTLMALTECRDVTDVLSLHVDQIPNPDAGGA